MTDLFSHLLTMPCASLILLSITTALRRGGRRVPRSGLRWIPVFCLATAQILLPAQAATYGYDANGRLQTATDSAGNTAHYVYDSRGNLIRILRSTSSQLAITSFIPNQGAPGSQVTVSGSGFSTTTSADTVLFNGTAAPVLSATANQLVVQVPQTATSGPISITTGGSTATSAETFSVTQTGVAPTIASVAPAVANYGSTLTITGTHFYPLPGQTAITIGGVNVLPTSISDQQISFVVPAFVGSGTVSVTTPFGTASSTQPLFLVSAGILPASVSSTGAMTPGQPATVLNLAANGYGAFVFQGTTGTYYSLQASAFSTANNLSYSVTSPMGVVVSSGNLSTTAPTIHLPKLPSTGTYALTFGAGSSAMQASITVEANPAIAISGTTVSFATSALSQSKRFTFTAVAGGQPGVRIQSLVISPTSVPSATVTVYGPDGSQLISANCLVSSSGCGFNMGTLPAAGIYSVKIVPNGAATMSFLASLTPEVTSPVLANGVSTTMTIGIPGQAGSLTFSGTAGQRISLRTSGNSLSASWYDVKIVNPNGVVLQAFSGFGSSSFYGPYTLPQTGTYTIHVAPESSGTGSISWALYNVPADTTAPIPSDGTSAAISVGAPGQAANLTFTGTAGQRISLKTGSNTLSGSWYDVKIQNPDGTTLQSFSGFGSNSFFGPYALAQTGTYTIHIAPEAGGTGTLSWQLYNVPADTTAAIPSDGSSNAISISMPGQAANLTFSGTAGQRISLRTGSNTLSGSWYDVKILNPDGTTLLSFSGFGSNSFFGPYTLPQTGTYTIHIAPEAGGTGALSWQLYYVPADISTPIPTNGTPTTISVATPGQAANLTFSGTTGQHITLVTSSNSLSGSWYDVKILNPNGTTLQSFSGFGSGSSFGPYTLPQTGIYTIHVAPESGGTGSLTWALTSS